ncbi:acetyltransferase [Deltaproteobacteria bacterium]|nr:acetyltransferase [Deltaproteobacteria bacterium]
MRIQIAAERPSSFIHALLTIWEASVSATHQFLVKKDILAIKPFVKTVLEEIPSLTYMAEAEGMPIGFMGVDGDKIEMLFISPARRSLGHGRRFIRYAVHTLGATYVDVNEQNTQGVGFYEHVGFKAFKRSAYDGQGNPFPLLHMKMDSLF